MIYGDEPWEPYNRVRLTQMLAGHSTWAEVFQSLLLPEMENIERRYNCAVVAIDIQQNSDRCFRQQTELFKVGAGGGVTSPCAGHPWQATA